MDKSQIQELISQGLSQRAIAKKLCVGHSTLVYWLKQHGLATLGKQRASITCLHCGKAGDGQNQKFCSHKCHRESEWERRKAEIEQTGIADSVKSAKKYLAATDGHRCKICDLTEWCGQKIPLILDHINGDPYDNRVQNLRLICSNCDSLLPTYKAKNKGNGRHARRERYKKDMSF